VSVIDYVIIGLYGLAVLGVGYATGRRSTSSQDLLLGRRSFPVWAVLLSMVATELSAATFIGVPEASYTGTWSYLQFAFGALLGKLVLARFVIPLYHRLDIVTVYGLLGLRFGNDTQRAAAGAFAVGRILASGVRLFIAALAFASVSGQSIELAIAFCGVIAVAYTRVGGIRSVIWTDVLQGGIFVLAALSLLVFLQLDVPGGLPAILSWAGENERSHVFGLDPFFSMTSTLPFGTAFFGGLFLTLATHATDHDMVQRLLTTRDGRSGGRALIGSALLNFPLTAIFLLIGTGIAYATLLEPGSWGASSSERILPLFALHELPAGARGLVFAGLFAAAMSSLDSAICAIASTWVVDIFPRPASGHDDDRGLVRRMRRISDVTGAVLILAAIAIALYYQHLKAADSGITLVEFALSAMSILYGGLLGVFARGIVSERPASDRAGVLGLIAGGSLGLVLFLQQPLFGEIFVVWTWWIPIAASLSFAISWLPIGRSAARVNRLPG
jgi:SSS family solute:Na+ symporter